MNTRMFFIALLLLWGSFDAIAQAPCVRCEKLKDLKLPDVRIVKVEARSSDTITVPWSPDVLIKKSFCRVVGTISSEINFEVLLPQQWNGRFIMSGGGAFVGSIHNFYQEHVNDGYATAGTDTGHKGDPFDGVWADNNMERQFNFARQALHLTTVVAKSIMEAYYCKQPSYSFFLGCSRGGGQGLVEAQFYPDDFDGIVAGAPAFSWPALGAKFISVNQKNYPDPKNLTPILTNDNLKLLQEYVLKQCDKLDGLTDKVITDPRDCKVDFSKLPLCANNQPGTACFTKEQLAVIRAVYEPLVVGNKTIYPEYPIGLEAEIGAWDMWISGTSVQKPSYHYLLSTHIYKYFVFNDSNWDYTKYEFKNYSKETQFAASFLDATQTDYGEFKKHNGKMIIFHGWNDPALSAYSTIEHYEAVMKKDKDLNSYIRLFLLPGVLHCAGGTGCDIVDWVAVIRDWVENNKAPDRVISSKFAQGKTIATRPVYPYPKVTVYSGSGDANEEKNYKVKQ